MALPLFPFYKIKALNALDVFLSCIIIILGVQKMKWQYNTQRTGPQMLRFTAGGNPDGGVDGRPKPPRSEVFLGSFFFF